MSWSARSAPYASATQNWVQERLQTLGPTRDDLEDQSKPSDEIALLGKSSEGYFRVPSDESEDENESSLTSDTPSERVQPLGLIFWLCVLVGLGCTAHMYSKYLTPSTVPVFVGLALATGGWMVSAWISVMWALLKRKETTRKVWSRFSIKSRIGLGLATMLVVWWAVISVEPSVEVATPPPTMIGNGDKYFFAVNLCNNAAIMPQFITQLTALILHLGRHDVFISIYESNSWDGTKEYLTEFDQSLAQLGVDYRIISVDNDPGKSWAYGTSPERIAFLAKCRNKAMEPLQSDDDQVRIHNWHDYTKVLFLNDIRFTWQDMVKLITTKVEGSEEAEDYDLACATDFGSSGFYDTWVARDICGTPFRAFWPYVADRPSQDAIRAEVAFEVSACWNGAVVMNAKPFLYNSPANTSTALSIDSHTPVRRATYPGVRTSPPLASPITFRTSGIDACDHSECFLLSYDLHRFYKATQGRRARIWMNPAVKVAYEDKWFHWNNSVLRLPIIRWWQGLWSHRVGYWLFDWPFEYFGRRRDYCTWSGLDVPTQDGRCDPLPGPVERHWNQ